MKCIEDEIPFELPKGWAWARLKHICMMAAGKAKPSYQIKSEPFEGCYPCFGGNGIRGYVDEYNQDGTFSIVGRQGALCGNINITSGKFYATEHAVVTTLFDGIDFNWSNYTLEALRLNGYATGAAQPGLSVANVLNVFVPVPPTQEQIYIGHQITKSIKIIENISNEKEDLQTLTFVAKSKILDLAIRGQLVPQNPDDEPASVLLERIRSEKEELIEQGKIKRDKKESIIFKGEDNSYYRNKKGQLICIDKELPYELPDGWTWAMLPEVVFFQEGPGILKKDFRENGVPLIRISGLKTEKVLLTGCDYLDEEMVKNKWDHFKLDLGDVVLCTSASIGKASIVGCEAVGAIPYTGQIRFKMSEAIIRDYFLYLATSSVYLDQVNKMKTGNCIQHYGPTHLKEVYVPLPPINEQEKIANKLTIIFSQFNSLENTLA